MKTLPKNDQPTIDAPASGRVMTIVNHRGLPLAEAEYWIDGEDFIVRSREFDCVVVGSNLDDALEAFGQAVYRHVETLQALDDNGEATETERETLMRLSSRLSRIFLEERRSQRRRRWPWRRGGGGRGTHGEGQDWLVHA